MDSTSFITSRTAKGHALFQSTSAADLFIDVVMAYRQAQGFLLHEFVVMPDCVHALVTPATGQSVERVVHFIKGGFSFRLKSAAMVWEAGSVNHTISDEKDFARHCELIWLSPIRSGLARSPEEYIFSSASGRYAVDPPPERLKLRLDFVTPLLAEEGNAAKSKGAQCAPFIL
jgi:putative transposase